MKILVLGGTGMLGYQIVKTCLDNGIDVNTVVRKSDLLEQKFGEKAKEIIHIMEDAKKIDDIENVIYHFKPSHVINCIGIVKQSHLANNYIESISINSLFPHQLERIGRKHHFRLIHISTDCVFDGLKGMYVESDNPNGLDLYGKSKHLGEVDYGTGITLRTSIIGHEISNPTHGLIEWFLSQNGTVKGFTRAIFSGLTTTELSNVILKIVIPQDLSAGLYHVAVDPISKYDLLKLVAKVYNKDIIIESSDELLIDRSLDAKKFNALTNYKPPEWSQLIETMKSDHQN